jgi:deoxyribose-phosphate aldolase
MIAASEIASMIDHSILHPTLTDNDLKKQCEIAARYKVATVCVKPYHVGQALSYLQKSDVGICAVVGFPHGNSTIEIKAKEAEQVCKNGATEVDMVVNIGKVLQGDWNYIFKEIKMIHEQCLANKAILKVIFETDYVKKDEDKIKLCGICNEIKVGFVKTSTGYGFVKGQDEKYFYMGATEHDLKLMRAHCIPSVKIKAAGGIRTLDQLLKVREIGVSRVGASATEQIMAEALKRYS